VSHDPDRDAAAFLGGAMRARRATAFEKHLLECEECWREVAEGRRGRALIESVRELAPAGAREDLRAAVAAAGTSERERSWLGGAAAAVALLGLGATLLFLRGPHQPAAITEAVADFRSGRMPVAAAPKRPTPDLSSAGLHLVGAGSGSVGSLGVDAYAYRDAAGRELLVYLSDLPFPLAAGAVPSDGAGSRWSAHDGDVQLLCAQRPHSMLLVSDQEGVLRSAAIALGVL